MLLSLLALALGSPVTVDGDYVLATYGECGVWGDPATGATGVEVRDADSVWRPVHTIDGGTRVTWRYSLRRDVVSHAITPSSCDLAPEVDPDAWCGIEPRYVVVYDDGTLRLKKTELWKPPDHGFTVQLLIENLGAVDLDDLELGYAFDPAPDVESLGRLDTRNDAEDVDGDGNADVALAVGASGLSVGLVACDAAAEVGASTWPPEGAYTDDDGALADRALAWRIAVPVLRAGEQTQISLKVATGATEADARAEALALRATCDACADNDGDGWFPCGGGDCDDARADVHPEAEEHCDGRDDDCDGVADDDAVDAPAWFNDVDGDGHGDATDAVRSCWQPAGYVDVGDDCAVRDAATYPGADEVCDGLDQDCDGVADNGLDRTFYPDIDGDGFGDGTMPKTACARPKYFVRDATDCDDLDGRVHPDATETCDGADDDCDGVVDEGCDVPEETGCGCHGEGGAAWLIPVLPLWLRRRSRR